MTDETLLDHVAHIVSAHVSHNAISAAELAGLIQSVHGVLAQLGQPAAAVAEKPVPAVSVRSSVKPDAMTCLDCGVKLKMLKRHLGTDHGLTPAEYRTRWNLPADYPMVAPNYAAQRKALAMQIGLGRKPAAAPVAEAKAPPAEPTKPAKSGKSAKSAKAAKLAEPAAKPVKSAKPRKTLGLAFDAD